MSILIVEASGRQLRPEDTEADGEADAEDDSISEVTTESIRPRPQGSSPVYEYCIEDEYFNKKLQQDIENRQRRDSTFKMSGSQESMEVTLQTEVESGASGFSVAGGGAEGIFVKQVLKETPASNLFSLKEGDQLLSATIFFDNIKYEDALKILQYSEPYKVQFNLKRKLLGKDELEAIHSATQSKKEKLSQGKKISGHRRSRSTSDAYEHGIPDVSPTSTDTESQFQPEEIHGKIKKQSQKKLKFPTIGFKMHKKQEPYEINPFKEYENDTTVELSEIMPREYTSLDVDRKPKEKEPKRGVSETVFPLPQHTRKYPDVELTITKSKEKKLKSNLEFTKQEPRVATTQMKTAVIQTKDIADSQITVSQNIPKMRKKKQKDSKVQIEKDEKGKEPNIASKYALPQIESPKVEVDMKIPKMDFSLPKADHKATKLELKMEEITTDINISELDIKSTARQGSLELKTTDQETNTTSDEIPADGSAITLEDDENKFKMLKLQMPKFGISLPKQKGIPQGELSISSMEADFPKTALKTELTTSEIEADIKLTDVQIEAPSLDMEIREKGIIKMPALKMPSVKVAKLKAPEVGVSFPKVETDVTLPKGKVEVSEGAAAIKLPEAEGTIDGGGLKIHMPKFKMPSMGFSKPDIKGPKVDVDVSMPKVDISLPEAKLHVEKPEVKGGDITISAPEVKIPTGSASLEVEAPEVDVEAPTGKVSVQGPDVKLESGDRKFQMPKFHMPKFGISLPKGKGIPEAEISVPSVEADIPKTELKAEVTLPSAEFETDLQLPQVEVDAPSLDVDVGDKGKIKMPEVKMPSVKVPKVKGPEVGISLPKVETDVTLPKGKVEVSEGAAAVKLPEAEGTIDGGGLKIHKPKFKMPSMGFSKPDIKGPKVDVDVIMPKVDISLPEAKLRVEKPEVKGGDISISAPEVQIQTVSASLEVEAPDVDIEAPTGKVSVQGPDVKLESGDRKFQMPKFHMPKFGISLPKGKGIPEAEISVPSVEADIPKTELKAEVTLPSAEFETDLQLPQVEVDAPSLDIDVGDKGKIKMPEVKMPSVKIPKVKGPEVGISLPKVETDVTLPKGKVEVSEGAAAVKLPEAEGTIDGRGLKIHKPKFKMPSMGFSKPDIKGPKVDVDVSMPKVDISLPEAKLHVEKPEVKGGDITISAPEVKIPTGSASLEVEAPEVDVEAPTGKVSVQGPDGKLESGDRKFQMPKFHMPKFGISLPKGKGIPEAEISVPSVEADIPKTELKAEVTLPSAEFETDLQLPQVEVDAPSLDIDIGDKGKIKMPEVKMPSVKVPKVKGPEVGISLPKVETDVTLPKGKVEVSEGAAAVKLPEAEGTIDGRGLKIHKPKFKMPSMGFSKPDIKGPKVDVDVSMPKVDISLPEAKLHVEKPQVKGGDITISAPEVKIPTGSASLELKAPEVDIEAPTGKVSVQGPDGKLESGDRKFQMPKFHMPKFGISLPKGKGIPEAEISVPSVEADIPKTELKAEVTLPSAEFETDLQLPQVEVDAPSLDIDIGDKGKIKMPEVKMPSVKVPKVKGPEVGISLPKVETDVTLPKGKVEVSEGAAAVKLPEAEGTIDGRGLKIHKPKFKMPSMGFSKPDIKGPKVDVDVSMPKVDISLPEAKLHIEKPEVKGGDITISAPEVKIPTGSASLELKAPEVDVEAPTGKVSVQGPDVKLESGDRKFQMPKFHMPKFGISLPKGKGIPEAEISVPSVEADIPKTELKAEVTLPSAEFETDLQLPQVEVDAPSLDIDIGDKGKIKMPEVKMPSVRVPKLKGPEVGISLPKVETDVTLPKGKVEVSEGAAAVKLPEAEGSIDGGGLKIHKPKFKMPSMGFSKPDIKGPKVDVDVSMPKVDISLPEAKLHIEKPEVKGGDITISAPEVKIPTGSASLEVEAPEVDVEAPTGKVSVQGPDGKLESGDRKFQMPKFHMPKFGISLPKGKGIPEAEISVPPVEADIPKTELKAEVTLPSAEFETDLQLPQVEVDAPSLDIDVGDKGKIKMPEVKMPSVKVPKVKGPEVGISLPKVETDVTLPKGKVEVSEGAAAVKLPEAEGTIDGGGLKIHKPKFKMPSMGFSKPDIKGPKVDVDVSMPKVDISLPEAKLHVEKPEVKGGDITISAPEVKIPTGSASLEVEAPEVDVEAPTGKVSVQGPDVKLESGDRKFQMPKFHMPKFGISLPKGKGVTEAEITVPSMEAVLPKCGLEITMPSAELEADIKLPKVEAQTPSLEMDIGEKGKITMPLALQQPKITLERGETTFKIPKFHMPKFEISVPQEKEVPEAETSIPSLEADLHKTGLKAGVILPSAEFEADIKLPKGEVVVPRLDIEVGDIDNINIPGMKMSSVKAPKLEATEVGISIPKVETDISVTKRKIEVPHGAAAIEFPETETTMEGGGMQIHMPKFKMPSMGFSKPDIKGPKVDVDVSMPKVDISLPEDKLHVEKPQVKGGDITISAPEVKIPTGSASLELKAPEVDIEAPTGKVSVQGPDGKLESGDRKFQMPKFHMPKFGISLPKGKGIPEAEISVPSVEADIPKTELKAEVTLPSAEFETDLQLPQVEVDAPSLDVDVGDKGKIKMPEVKMPSVKVPKVKGPEVGISLPKVETDVTLPKGKVEVSEGAAAVKLPEAEGTIDGRGLKIHKPKFKMPSMGFSKPDIKGPKVDVDVSMPKVDISLPEAKLHIEKPEVKGGDITISAPEVKIPTGSASLELKAPEVDVEAPTGKVSVQGPDVKLESGDRKFQMPKFHMPKFGISLPKGKGIPEAEISVPPVEADIPKTELKAEVTLPSAEFETDLQLPQVEVDVPSLDIDIGDKGKIKMPEVKMPSVKVPKVKGPEVGISLPKVETDVTLPKGKVEVSEGAAAVKLPEAEGTIDGGGLKIHMPKFKMPSMGFSKPDIKGPKVDVDVSMPKVDISLPEAKLHVEKPEVKGGDITISAPEVKIPTGSASLELKAPEVDIEAPTGKVSVQGPDGKLESGDRKFQMPKFHMPKFGISLPKGKGIPEAEISVPPVEADIPKTELKAEVTLPSAEFETDLQLPQVEVDVPSLDIDVGDKGKIKMPEVKMPSVRVPKLKGPEVGISLPKVETDVTLPKGKVEVSEGAAAVKLPEAEGTIDGRGLKIHKPKFKMPSMGFSKPDIKGPKVDVDVSMPKVDISLPEAKLHVEKPEVKGGDITISAPKVKIPTGLASLEVEAPEVDVEAPTGKVSVQGPDGKLESGDRKFQMPKFHMPKFGISLPKGKGIPEAEISVPSVEADIPKTELKAEVTLPSAEFETDLQLPQVEVDVPSLDIDVGDKGKIKMPEVKMPSVKIPKVKGPEVGISLPKVETDVTLPKGKVEVSEGAAAVKLPEAEGSIDGGGLKIHKPKFKMPSMGFSKPDIKGPKVDVDVSMPKVDISLPEAKLHVEKPEVKGGDITISAPEVKIPTGSASLELKAPEVDVEAPTGKVSVQGPDGKLESGDRKFQMPKFHMPKFGISLPKGKGIPEAEISVPPVEADIPKTELKAEVTLPSAEFETDLQLPQVEVDAPSLDIDIGDKGKIKMPEVKMPSVKVPKVKGPEVGISLPKVETDVTLPKGKVEVSEGAAAVKLPEAEGTIDGRGLKIHKPKFKMPSMGFSKPDIKGPKVDVDVSMPKVDISLPEAKLHVEKPEVKGGDITISAPEVKIPTGSASLEVEAPEVDVEAPTGKVSVQGPDGKLESGDRKFQMPKFHMPKFGISLPKGKGIPEAEISVPSVEADIPKTELKAEVTLPSAEFETDLQLPQVEVDAPSLDIDVGDKGKIKMPEVKMPSVKVPKVKGPEVGISLPKVETDVTFPKGKVEVSEGAAAVKLPEAEGTIDGGGLKIHKPKFKMPSMGFSKPDIKGPKVDVDVSMPKVDISLPEAKLHVEKPEVKGGDITISAPEVKIPTGSASLELKAPEVDVEAPTGKVSVQGPDGKLESGDRKFQMPKFHMPKFGISLPKGKGIPEAEISVPSVEADIPKTELKAEVTLPSAEFETDLQLPQVEVDVPSLDIDVGDKGKIKMPEVKMPSVKVPKVKGPEVGISLPKVETDVTLPKGKVEVSEGAAAVKLPEAEGTIDGGGLKIHKPKFKMPSMGFSKPDIKGPKVDVDVNMPKVDISLPEAKLRVEKPEVKGGDISISAPEVKIPTGSASLEVEAPDVDIEAPTGKVSVQGPDVKLESGDRKFQMPKFHMPKFGISLPKGKGVTEAEITVPSMEAVLPKCGLEITMPSAELEADIKLPKVEAQTPSLEMDIGEKGKITMPLALQQPKITLERGETTFKIPKFHMPKFEISVPQEKEVPEAETSIPSLEADLHKTGLKAGVILPSAEFEADIKLPKGEVVVPRLDIEVGDIDNINIPGMKMSSVKAPKLEATEVGISIPKVETDISVTKRKIEVPHGAAAIEFPETETTMEGGGMQIHMPKFKMPSMGFSKPDIKGPKVDVDVSMPKVDISLPEAKLHIEKPEVKGGDITISAPEVKIPTGSASLEVEAPEVDVEAPTGKVSIQGPDVKLESGDRKFQMPKFHMPKFGISLPKGKGIPEAEISVPPVEADIPKTELKAEVTLPSAEFETDLQLPQVEVDAPSLDIDVGDKGKIKMPEVKMPSVKIPKVKGPEVGISLPKVETDVTLPKGKVEVSEGAAAVKLPEAEGTIDGGGLKIHMPKFKMPSMGFSKPDIKGPKVDVDVSMPKVDISLPEAKLHIEKPEVKGGDITISAPEVKIPTGSASLELKAPEVDVEAPTGKVSVQGPDGKLESGDRKFQMPKFHMPKFGISLPKGKGIPEAEISVPSVEADIPKTELKAEVTLPSAEFETDLQLPQVEVDAPSLDIDVGDKGKIKMPEVKMPSVKVPKVKGPEVGISLPKVETDVTLPKGKVEVSEGAAAVKLPEAEGTIDGGGLKIHKPKFKMPSMGFSKPDIKGPKVDVDVSMPKLEASLAEAELCPAKPELKQDKPLGEIDISALGSEDSKFKMPKVQMPKVGISGPKEKGFSEGEVTIPSMEGDLPKTGLKTEITLPSSQLEADITLPEVNREAPILDVDVEEKGKIQTPQVKLPSVKPPKLTAPEIGISLPKVEGDVFLPKAKAELPDSEAASKVAEAEGSREKGRMKIHMPKFKMPSMGFSKSDIKGPKIDSDTSMPDVHTSLPKVELSTTKPQLKPDEFEGDIRRAAPEVKIPWVPVTVELQAPDVEVQASSGAKSESTDSDFSTPKRKADSSDSSEINVCKIEIIFLMQILDVRSSQISEVLSNTEMESDVLDEKKDILEQKIKMPQIIRADVKTAAVGIPSVDISVTQSEVSTQDLHGAVKEPEAKGQITKRGSLDGEVKGHFKMPKFKLPSLSWSPKKEASLKTNIKEPLQESNLGIVSVDTGTEPKVTLSEDQGVHTDGNVDIAIKKGQVKRPHLIMPKISLSKTKLPKAKVDIAVEGDGALVQIPDIENSFTTRKVEETEISVKMLKSDIKEIKTFQTDTDISLPKTDIKVSMTKSSFEQKCLETELKGDVCLDSGSMKSDGTEGEFRMPKLKMPKFGISDLSESEISDLSGSGITLSKPESDASQFQMTTESEELGGKTQPLQVKSDEEISEEIQTEESQSWFKMPKFKIPSFGRTSKTKKSDAEIEDITGEARVTELQAEVKSPEVVTISRELDNEKSTSEQKVMLPQKDVRVQKEQQSTTDQLMDEGSFLQSSEKIGRKPSDLESKTYADIVKEGAEGQSSQTEFIGTIPKMDIERDIPKTEMTIQQPQVIPGIMAVAEIPSTEITMGKKIDASITDPELLQSLDRQDEKMGTEKKSPKKDSQGKESIFKMPTFSVPLFGWSTTKSDAIVPGIESDLEEPAVTLSKVKVDVSITDEDFEIIDFPVEGFEKDLPKEGEVKAEEKEKTNKMKASKFKIPIFANLRSKSQGGEMQIDSPKVQTEVSLVRPEGETSGIQIQDKKPGDAEESFQMPKFKMLKFTHRISEGEKLTSEETMDIKDTADGDISQLQFKTMFPEEKGDDIQKSKVRITTLSEPAIQRPQVGSKFQSTDSSFVDTTMYVHKQVPKEFSAEFLKEKMDTMDNKVQKSTAKITTLKEPDIQRAPLEIKLQPDDPFSSSAPVQVKGSITESKEIKMESKSSFGCGDLAEIQESFSTQIVKESEIPPSEVQTAAFGFSLLKVKIQESHVSLDVPVKLSSTKCMGEIFEDKDHQLSSTGEAAQKAGLSEVKPSDKDITYEYIEGTSSAATLTTLKSFTVDIQSSGEFAESHSEPIEISKSATETAGGTAFTSSIDEVTDEKDSKRSGRFKLWFPSIGFSPTTDDTTSESKPEAQQKVQPDDSSKLDNDTTKETEKAGWFRFPKLGFSSPTKKSKEVGKEKETDSKEGKGEESPTDKNETFFDAQETLALKEKEENETSGDIPSEPIVSSSARTELILLEKGKAEPKHTPEDPSK
ncbi:hypothetical protein E2320_021669 [Naja naja]|nr:hypothetical protein E2320_021669 [Naja naja]